MTELEMDRIEAHIVDKMMLTILRGARRLLERDDPEGVPIFDEHNGAEIAEREKRERRYYEGAA